MCGVTMLHHTFFADTIQLYFSESEHLSMKTDYYRVILYVAETGNISKASSDMGYSQSGVSHIINRVEQELHQVLFSRSNEGVVPLATAAPLFDLMRTIVNAEDEMKNIAKRETNNIVRLSTLPSISAAWIPSMLSYFATQAPNYHFEIYERKDYIDIVNDIKDGITDIGFVNDVTVPGLLFYPCYNDPYYAIGPSGHPLENFQEISVEELMDFSFIPPEEIVRHQNFNISALCNADKIPTSFVRNPIDDWTTIRLVESGMGTSIIPGLYLFPRRYEICSCPIKEGYHRTIGLCIRKENERNPEISASISMIRKWITAWENK
jgi:DNA-binding transcriptional LysR family regulator